MNEVIYGLCVATSLLCAILLLRAYFKTRHRLLLWSGICFILLGLSNVLVCLDVYVIKDVDLFLLRSLVTLSGVAVLLFGLIWETN
jgi:hypothetical protein